jgi:predicted O-methyltransferase YrrM
MARKVALSPRNLSDVFWGSMLAADDERRAERDDLAIRFKALDPLRSAAEYNTGSISLTAGWCIYNLVRHFRPTRVLEVGTFIGRTAVAMATAMDAEGLEGEIFTCDSSNSMVVPWEGRTRLQQFPLSTSKAMLAQLSGQFDLVLLDGRLSAEDLPLLEKRISTDTIFLLDDFEGGEKGVVNMGALYRLPMLKNHMVLYPPSPALLARYGLPGYSLAAVLAPMSTFILTKQG